MNQLSKRLTQLRKQTGSAVDESSGNPLGNQLLAKLKLARARDIKPPQTNINDEEIAQLVGGTVYKAGLISIKRTINLNQLHSNYNAEFQASLTQLVSNIDPQHCLLVDTETTGLSTAAGTLVFLLGAAYTLQIDEHVRVDVIYTNLSDYKKAWINLLGSVVLLIPFCIVAIIAAKNFVINSYIMHETSPNPGGLPARYILKTFIPLSMFFLLLQGTSLALKSFIRIMNHKAAGKMPEAGK